jgi:hypothetical protein
MEPPVENRLQPLLGQTLPDGRSAPRVVLRQESSSSVDETFNDFGGDEERFLISQVGPEEAEVRLFRSEKREFRGSMPRPTTGNP